MEDLDQEELLTKLREAEEANRRLQAELEYYRYLLPEEVYPKAQLPQSQALPPNSLAAKQRDPATKKSLSLDDFDFSTFESIDEGRSGEVFKVVYRETSEPVAVKVLREHPCDLDEIALLQELNHKNIIQVFAHGNIGSGVFRDRYGIVFEFCSHGSLSRILKLPQNQNGLRDPEYLLLLECIRHSFEYLRSKHILHRDIKPLNICLHVERDEANFKLIDFGSAKSFQGGQRVCLSNMMAGTLLYWHPRLNNCYLTNEGDQTVSDKVYIDLWSIGTTLYEAACGKKPFQPLSGNIPAKLNEAFNKKKVGEISMREVSAGYWQGSRFLPQECNLSQPLSLLITPMLAGLMEKNTHEVWTVDMFIDYCDKILKIYQSRRSLVLSPTLENGAITNTLYFVLPMDRPNQVVVDYATSEFATYVYDDNGKYPTVKWTNDSFHRWRRLLVKDTSDEALYFPPLALPPQFGNVVAMLCLQWNKSLDLCGFITACDDSPSYEVVRVPMEIKMIFANCSGQPRILRKTWCFTPEWQILESLPFEECNNRECDLPQIHITLDICCNVSRRGL